ncbi:tail protein X [Paludibacteraceae bacterium OttesenSCG-928-F17]|nr:tail protein X [Paludibacteraceae bacterium OttesenSCG-928-F17]
MDSINYKTVEGDRIDTLAQKYYGGMQGIKIIADANPSVPLDAIFPMGTVLLIPIIDDEGNQTKENLPPWKQ